MSRACSSCYYWVAYNKANGSSMGQCRVNPPTLGVHRFPHTKATDWCGCYRNKASVERRSDFLTRIDEVRHERTEAV